MSCVPIPASKIFCGDLASHKELVFRSRAKSLSRAAKRESQLPSCPHERQSASRQSMIPNVSHVPSAEDPRSGNISLGESVLLDEDGLESAVEKRRKSLPRRIKENLNKDGVDRRGFLQCMAWAGTGAIWTVSGGVLSSKAFAQMMHHDAGGNGEFSFVQISDSHIGFNKEASKDVTATLQEAIAKINGLKRTPDFLIHTGDLSHLSKPREYDTSIRY
jgi:hypothetical protein